MKKMNSIINKINIFMQKNINIIFYWLFALSIIVDNINGLLIQQNITTSITIGQIYRILTIILLFYYFIVKFTKKDKYLLIFLSFLFTLPIIYSMINDNFGLKTLISEYIYQTKLLYPIFIIVILKKTYDAGYFDKNTLNKIFKFYIYFAPLSIIIPKIIGIGYEAYLNSGYRGLYVANNEINIVLLTTFLLCLKDFYDKVNLNNSIKLFINFIALFLIGSKTSLIVIFCSIAIYFYKLIKNKKKKMLNKKTVLISCTAFALVLFAFKDFIINIYYRFLYFYDVLVIKGNNTFITFLLSGRDTRILPIIEKNVLNSKMGFINFFIGVGRENQFDANVLTSLIEMDFFDTFIWYGIIIASLVLIFYSKILIDAIKQKKEKIFIVIYFVIYFFALIAGHVWFSPLSGGIYALVATVLILNKKKENKNVKN